MVKDAEAIRQRLKINKWKVFGQSNGGMIANRYVMLAPESISAVFNYGSVNVETMSDFYLARIEGAYDLGRAIQKYEPDLYSKIKLAKAEMNANQVCLTYERGSVCGEVLFDAFIGYLSGLPGRISFFNDLEAKDENGKLTGKLDLEKIKSAADAVISQYFTPDIAAFHSIYLNELVSVSKSLNFAEDCALAEKKFEKYNYASADEILVSECRLTRAIFGNQKQLEYLNPIAQLVPRKTIDLNLVIENLKRFRIPYFLYSGGMDGIAGQRSSLSFAMSGAKQINYRSFPAWGHGGYNYESILWEDIVHK